MNACPIERNAMSEKCKVEHTNRTVIENKLLVALEEKGQVAILATEDDLNILIGAIEHKLRGNWVCGKSEFTKLQSYKEGLKQLRQGAFGK